LGRAGLRNTRVGGEVELASYALAAEYWNRRMATGVEKATLKLAFKRLGLTNTACFTLCQPTGRRGA
jgi:RimJ/RimL family protein N-acetyltransferase